MKKKNRISVRLRAAALLLTALAVCSGSVFPVLADEEETQQRTDSSELPEHITPDDGDIDINDDFPAAFDLRNVDGINYVTPVKSQGGWGTCWGFGATAASETSMLYEMVNKQGMKIDGYDLDLSELQLAWFANKALPMDDNSVPSQRGEGCYIINFNGEPEENALTVGGFSFTATSIYSMGIGPISEEDAPYQNKSGNTVDDNDGFPMFYKTTGEDWSVPEEYRFQSIIELENGNILPSPAVITGPDKNGKYSYSYNEQATLVMKQELMNGRAISVSYFADSPSYDALDTEKHYISDKYAHYTYDTMRPNHVVCIVGWDDNYPRSSFLQGTTEDGRDMAPPADGAWIVKNSWGCEGQKFPHKNSWGVDNSGYFYLSYYDRSISTPETFDFYTENLSSRQEYLTIDQYDLMPTNTCDGYLGGAPIVIANVFSAETDQDLRALSTETVLPNTEVTFAVYKLNKSPKSPIDGEMIFSTVVKFDYAGYHRIDLDEPIRLREDDRFSVTVSEKTQEGYTTPVKKNTNKAYAMEKLNDPKFIENSKDIGAAGIAYYVGVINRGESFMFAPDDDTGGYSWSDLADSIGSIKEIDIADNGGDYMTYDNFPIKAYSDPLLKENSDVLLRDGIWLAEREDADPQYIEIVNDGSRITVIDPSSKENKPLGGEFMYNAEICKLRYILDDTPNNTHIAYITADGEDKAVFDFNNGDVMTLRFLTDKTGEDLSFYDDSELAELAVEYYRVTTGSTARLRALATQYEGGLAEMAVINDDTFEILAAYKVDRLTAAGTDRNGNAVDLTAPVPYKPAEESSAADSPQADAPTDESKTADTVKQPVPHSDNPKTGAGMTAAFVIAAAAMCAAIKARKS